MKLIKGEVKVPVERRAYIVTEEREVVISAEDPGKAAALAQIIFLNGTGVQESHPNLGRQIREVRVTELHAREEY